MTTTTIAFIAAICAICGFFLGFILGAFAVLERETAEVRKTYSIDETP